MASTLIVVIITHCEQGIVPSNVLKSAQYGLEHASYSHLRIESLQIWNDKP